MRTQIGPLICSRETQVGVAMAAALALLVTQAQAQFIDDDVVVKQTTAEQVHEIMRADGYAVDVEDDLVLWRIDGRNAAVQIAGDGRSLMFLTRFTDAQTTLSDVNEWNRTKRWSRTYLDEDGEPVLELDLDITDGVTVGNMRKFFRTARDAFSEWEAEVVR